MKRNILFVTVGLSMAFLAGCNQQYPGYKKTKNGVYYRFVEKNKKGVAPKPSDYLKMEMSYFLNDSIMYSWTESGDFVRTQLNAPKFRGDLQSGLALMHEGDSASFIVPADSTLVHAFGADLSVLRITPEDRVRYEIRLVQVQTEEAFKAEVAQLKEDMSKKSAELFEAYVRKNASAVQPTESGIYVIPLTPGKGKSPVVGDEVELDYSVSLITNDSLAYPMQRNDHFVFVVGEGYAIPAWEEVVPTMRLGESVRAITPSKMAYGEHAVEVLNPYFNLVYDMKLVKITPASEVAKRRAEEMKALKEKSEMELSNYLKSNNVTIAPQPSGLYHIIRQEGIGPRVEHGMVARVRYSTSFLDGTLIGTSDGLGKPYYEMLVGGGKVLKGLDEGVSLMHEGEKATLILPYALAYGDKGYMGIPPYSNLVFDVELLDILSKEEQLAAIERIANENLDKYLKDKGIKKSCKQPSGLVYCKTQDGTGGHPKAGSKVTVHYVGRLLDGTVFESSLERGAPLNLVLGTGRGLKGFEEGVMMMQKGEKATLVLPFNLAYGDRQIGIIPPFSPLVFDVELIDIENTNN